MIRSYCNLIKSILSGRTFAKEFFALSLMHLSLWEKLKLPWWFSINLWCPIKFFIAIQNRTCGIELLELYHIIGGCRPSIRELLCLVYVVLQIFFWSCVPYKLLYIRDLIRDISDLSASYEKFPVDVIIAILPTLRAISTNYYTNDCSQMLCFLVLQIQ